MNMLISIINRLLTKTKYYIEWNRNITHYKPYIGLYLTDEVYPFLRLYALFIYFEKPIIKSD